MSSRRRRPAAGLVTEEAPRKLSDRERVDSLLDEVTRLQAANRRLEAHVGILTLASFEMLTDAPGAVLLDPER